MSALVKVAFQLYAIEPYNIFNRYRVLFFSIMEWCDEYPVTHGPCFLLSFSPVSLTLLEMICYCEHNADWRWRKGLGVQTSIADITLLHTPIGSVQLLNVSDSLQPHKLQHARLPSPSSAPGAHSNLCPLSWWCHPPLHPLSSPSPPAFNLFQQQGLFKWVSSLYQMAKVLKPQLQCQSFQWLFRTDFL